MLSQFNVRLLILATTQLFCLESFANARYGMAGCGLGSLVLGHVPGKAQILAVTTNNIYGNQTSGITSGTSNCTEYGHEEYALTIDYINANKQNILVDIARGEGEALKGLATLYGCKNHKSFSAALKFEKHPFLNAKQTGSKFHETVLSIMQSNQGLLDSCSNV